MAVVDGRPCPQRLGPFGLLGRAHGADQLGAQGLGPLAGQRPYTTGCGMEQDHIARLHFIGLLQQVLNGQTLEHHRCRLLEADGVRQLDQVGFR